MDINTYFLCKTQYVNVGDLLINKMLINEYSRFGKVYLDCPDAPEDFRKFLFDNNRIVDVNMKCSFSVSTRKIFRFPSLLRKYNISVFSRSPGPIAGPVKKNNGIIKKIVSYYLHTCLRLSNVKECLVGKCCSAIEARCGKINIVPTTEIYVRSLSGVSYMRSLGFSNVHYIPDLAYLLHFRVQPSEKRKIAIISFRTIKTDKTSFFNWLSEIIDYLLANNYQIEMYHQVKKDKDFMDELYNRFKREGVVLKENLLWYDSFNYYADKDIVISNRLHSLLIGAVYNCIPLAFIDGDPLTNKISDVFCSSLSIPERFLSRFEESNKIKKLINDKELIREQLQQDCQKNADLCRSTIESIFERRQTNWRIN